MTTVNYSPYRIRCLTPSIVHTSTTYCVCYISEPTICTVRFQCLTGSGERHPSLATWQTLSPEMIERSVWIVPQSKHPIPIVTSRPTYGLTDDLGNIRNAIFQTHLLAKQFPKSLSLNRDYRNGTQYIFSEFCPVVSRIQLRLRDGPTNSSAVFLHILLFWHFLLSAGPVPALSLIPYHHMSCRYHFSISTYFQRKGPWRTFRYFSISRYWPSLCDVTDDLKFGWYYLWQISL